MNTIPIKKNQLLEMEIDALTGEGAGVGRLDGYVLLVSGALPGERIRTLILRVTPGYGIGKLVEVLRPSPNRVEPNCPAYPRCGGCTLRHLSYAMQLEEKRKQVGDALVRIGGLSDAKVQPVLGMAEPDRYRNKGAFPYGYGPDGRLTFGFFASRSHRLIPAENCAIERPEVMECIRAMGDWARKYAIEPYDERTHQGCLRHGVVRVTGEGKTMAVLVTTGSLPHKKELLASLPMADTVYHNVNERDTNVIMGEKLTLLKGEPALTDNICGLNFRVSPHSFLQVNAQQTRVLYETALSFLDPQSQETIADLYCGMGAISLLLAKRCKKVLGIENVPAAVEDAKENARLNGITNTDFLCAPAEEALPVLMAQGLVPDAITLDPPRKGCDKRVLEAILASSVRRLVYVSCNPATLARDLQVLTAGGFHLLRVQPVDMFPHTGHIETVVLLSKGEIDSKKVRVEFSLEDMDMSGFQKGATYEQIKAYVLEHTGLKVSSLYISQIKRKCGLDVGQNYNLSKKEDAKVPKCPPEKEAAIRDALKYFQMI